MQELAVDVLGVISALLPKDARDQFRLVSRDWYAAAVTTHLTGIHRPRLLLPAWERHLLEGGRWARVTEVSGRVAANLDELPEVVQQSLRRVTFYTAPSAAALAALAQCAGLRALGVTHASGAMLLAVAGSCPNLEELVLHELTTEDVSVGLAAMPGLKRLHAMLAKPITDDGLAGLRSLEDVTLVNCDGLTDAGLAALGAAGTLRAVRLRSAFDCKLTNQGALALIRGNPNLTELELPRGVLANDDTLVALARCKGLRALTAFTGPWNPFTDAGIAALAGGCPRLQVLGLRLAAYSDGHEAVSGAGAMALARGCPALRRVELRVPLRLTVADAAAVVAACPGLHELVPRGTSTLTAAGIRALRRLPAADPLRKRALDAEAVQVLNAALALSTTGTSQRQ